ncbi:MAG: hypothetical protein LBO06_05425 [Bacteroidales bacterium]|jgi:hypothetical protein|nr:hypothetical protein [Bacteroidales bacterium]
MKQHLAKLKWCLGEKNEHFVLSKADFEELLLDFEKKELYLHPKITVKNIVL